jgi:NADPH-dependent glutamate synthase beta subunit-like oxidoreductase
MTYNDIKTNLDNWSKEHNGSYGIVTTIEIKSPNLSVRVEGTSVEDAFDKIVHLCSKQQIETKKENSVLNTNTFQENTQSPIQTVAPITSPEFIQEATKLLNGRQLVRVHNNSQPIGFDEELVTISGTVFVVKK